MTTHYLLLTAYDATGVELDVSVDVGLPADSRCWAELGGEVVVGGRVEVTFVMELLVRLLIDGSAGGSTRWNLSREGDIPT